MSFQLKIAPTKMQEMFRKTVFPKTNQLIRTLYTTPKYFNIELYVHIIFDNKCNMQLNDFQFYTIPNLISCAFRGR